MSCPFRFRYSILRLNHVAEPSAPAFRSLSRFWGPSRSEPVRNRPLTFPETLDETCVWRSTFNSLPFNVQLLGFQIVDFDSQNRFTIAEMSYSFFPMLIFHFAAEPCGRAIRARVSFSITSRRFESCWLR